MRRLRRDHPAGFKVKVVLAVMKDDKTLVEVGELFDVHPSQISEWKQQFRFGRKSRVHKVKEQPE